jgi:hypothetical protein
VPGARRVGRTPPVIFDEVAWEDDLRRASAAAREVARTARAEFETLGIALEQLKPCSAEGADGTELPGCVKVYVPAPSGPHGMVFEIERIDRRLQLLYAAFGLRHPARDSRQPSVYAIAHRRLHANS